jgi:hypothetical protein
MSVVAWLRFADLSLPRLSVLKDRGLALTFPFTPSSKLIDNDKVKQHLEQTIDTVLSL